MPSATAISANLSLRKGAASPVGPERIALLEAIGAHGSIRAAAKAVGLSYKGAWDAVQALNNLHPKPMVLTRAGGRGGGVAEVTAEGRTLIQAYAAVEGELARALAALERRLADPSGAGPLSLIWSLSMKTSARNALRGVVEKVEIGAVNAEVSLKVSDDLTLIAVVTRGSVDDLGLEPGREAIALIKASFVILAPGEGDIKTSARNCLKGTVVRREDGAVNTEISLELSVGKTLTATVTRASADALELEPGKPAMALIKASHVILAVA